MLHNPAIRGAIGQNEIVITVFENTNTIGGNCLNKQVHIAPDGTLEKINATHMAEGNFHIAHLPFEGEPRNALDLLAQLLPLLGSNHAIGLCRHADPNLVAGAITTVERAVPGAYAKTKENFVAPDGAGLLLLDDDNGGGLRDNLIGLHPLFADIAMLTRKSGGSGIYSIQTGEVLPGGGEHGYIVISDASRGKEVLEGINRLGDMHGYFYVKLTSNGQMRDRGIVDASVGSPERLVYEGQTLLGPGVGQQARAVKLFDGIVLDVDLLLNIVDHDAPLEKVLAIRNKAKQVPSLIARQKEVAADWKRKHAAKLEQRGMSPAAAKEAADLACRRHGAFKGTLVAGDIFLTDGGTEIRYADILLNPAKYAGTTGFDPIEGRSKGRCKAMIMWSNDGRKPGVHSFVHGEGTFRISWDFSSLAAALASGSFPSHDAFIEAMTDAEVKPSETDKLHHQAAKAFAGVKFTTSRADLKAARASARKQQKERQKEPSDKCSRRIRIEYRESDPTACVDRVEGYFANLQEPVFYNFGKRLTIISNTAVADLDEPDPYGVFATSGRSTPSAIAVSEPQARYHVSSRIEFTGFMRNDNGELEEVPVKVPNEVIKMLVELDRGQRKVPRLLAIRSTPPIDKDGNIRTEAGFRSGIYYNGSCGNISIPDNPTRRDAQQAWQLIFDAVLWEFPFEDKLDEAVALAFMLTVMLRHEIDTAPAFLVDAPLPGTGKSLLARIMVLIVLGTPAPAVGFKNDDEAEVRKALTTWFSAGVQVLLYDNVTGRIGNEPLDRALTASVWGDRILGETKRFEGQITTTLIFTANGARIIGDTTRRFIKLGLNAVGHERPEKRPIQNRRLPETVMARRPELVAALLTIIKAFRQAGSPGDRVLGSYDQWVSKVALAVEWVTGVDVTSGQDALADDDPKRQARVAIYARWLKDFGYSPKTAAEAYVEWACDDQRSTQSDLSADILELHEQIREITESRETFSKDKFSKMLSSFHNVPVNGYTMKRTKPHAGSYTYQLRPSSQKNTDQWKVNKGKK